MTRRLLFAVLALLAVALPTTTTSIHALSITETDGSEYEPCSDEELAPLATKIRTESNECAAKSSYAWNGIYLPTAAQRTELCTCTTLISKLQTVKVPHCGFYRVTPDFSATGGFYSYKGLIKLVFDDCNPSSSTAAMTTTTTTTDTDTPTPSSYNSLRTSTPSIDVADSTSSSSTKKSKSKTGTIIGVIVGVVVVAAIAAFVIRKRKQKKGSRASRSSVEEGVDAAVAMDVEAAGDLSPLGGAKGGEGSYTSMPSPSAPHAKDMA